MRTPQVTITPQIGDLWYRIEDRRYANSVDEDGESRGSHPAVDLLNFRVRRLTPKGVVLVQVYGTPPARLSEAVVHGTERVVIGTHTKKYANPTLALALESFLARKARQRSILNGKIQHVDDVVQMARRRWGSSGQQGGFLL